MWSKASQETTLTPFLCRVELDRRIGSVRTFEVRDFQLLYVDRGFYNQGFL